LLSLIGWHGLHMKIAHVDGVYDASSTFHL
jgi:hypothetical protein